MLKDELVLQPKDDDGDTPSPALSVGDAYDALESFAAGLNMDRQLVAYVSTPITTGLAFYELVAARGEEGTLKSTDFPELRDRAMIVNARSAERVVKSVVDHNIAPLCIDPTPLKVKGSSQDEYLDFWVRFIRRRVGTLVLAPGWQFSTGSTTECVAAFSAGIRVLDDGLTPMSQRDAHELVTDAMSELEALGFRPPGIARNLRDLARLPKP